MEIKINREIRDFSESVFFGLSLRQFLASLLALAAAVLMWVFGREKLGTEALSWLCMAAAAGPAFVGFFRWQEMPAEQVLWTLFRYAVLTPRTLPGTALPFYAAFISTEKKGENRHAEKYPKSSKKGAGTAADSAHGPGDDSNLTGE